MLCLNTYFYSNFNLINLNYLNLIKLKYVYCVKNLCGLHLTEFKKV